MAKKKKAAEITKKSGKKKAAKAPVKVKAKGRQPSDKSKDSKVKKIMQLSSGSKPKTEKKGFFAKIFG